MGIKQVKDVDFRADTKGYEGASRSGHAPYNEQSTIFNQMHHCIPLARSDFGSSTSHPYLSCAKLLAEAKSATEATCSGEPYLRYLSHSSLPQEELIELSMSPSKSAVGCCAQLRSGDIVQKELTVTWMPFCLPILTMDCQHKPLTGQATDSPRFLIAAVESVISDPYRPFFTLSFSLKAP